MISKKNVKKDNFYLYSIKMLYSALNPNRFYMLYVYHGILLIVFVMLICKILSRSKRTQNILLSLFFIFLSLGIILNMVYAIIIQEILVLFLNFLTNYLITFSLVFILLFNLNLLRRTYKLKTYIDYLIVFLWGSLLFLKILFFVNNGVIINETTNWMPKWNLQYLIYVLLIKTLFMTIPIIYTSIKLYKLFDHEILKKRWKYFVIGYIGLILYMDFNFSNNYTSHPIIVYGLYISILGIIPYILLIYYGIGKQLG